MRDYSYQDMLRMQEDAAVRVREMKKRAAIIAAPEQEEGEVSSEGGLLSKLLSDTESLLIVAVLALLVSENTDNLTGLALLYILL